MVVRIEDGQYSAKRNLAIGPWRLYGLSCANAEFGSWDGTWPPLSTAKVEVQVLPMSVQAPMQRE